MLTREWSQLHPSALARCKIIMRRPACVMGSFMPAFQLQHVKSITRSLSVRSDTRRVPSSHTALFTALQSHWVYVNALNSQAA